MTLKTSLPRVEFTKGSIPSVQVVVNFFCFQRFVNVRDLKYTFLITNSPKKQKQFTDVIFRVFDVFSPN